MSNLWVIWTQTLKASCSKSQFIFCRYFMLISFFNLLGLIESQLTPFYLCKCLAWLCFVWHESFCLLYWDWSNLNSQLTPFYLSTFLTWLYVPLLVYFTGIDRIPTHTMATLHSFVVTYHILVNMPKLPSL